MRAGGGRPLGEHPLIKAGAVAWAIVGLVTVGVIAALVVAQLRLVVVPLLVALFPAALLAPGSEWLKRRGAPPAVAALVMTLGFIVTLSGVLGAIGWLIAGEMTQVISSVEEAYAQIQGWSQRTVGADVPDLQRLIDQAGEWVTSDDGLRAIAPDAALATVEVTAAVLFGLVALFFYLKDGARVAAFLRDLFPRSARDDVHEVGQRIWYTLGAYFRGQLLVAAVDALFIGLGLLVLGVPLALPLAVLVFIGGLFPIVGAFTAGAVAVLIALADGGVLIALAVLGINVAVQQAEGNILEPLIVGRATQLHPLAVLVALTSGAVTLGVLGAFLAVPVTASVVRGIGYFRDDVEDPIADELDDSDSSDGQPPGD